MHARRVIVGCLSSLLLSVACAHAAPIQTITNYFPGYICVTHNWDLAASGLDTNAAYACIPLAALPAASPASLAATGTTSDIRILLYAVCDAAYTNYVSADPTNRPANAAVHKIQVLSGNQYQIRHQLDTTWSYTAILTLE
jgi:hypothetical protein